MTEEQIEARVEVMTNGFDRKLMTGLLSQQEYDLQMRVLSDWAEKKLRERTR